MTFDDIVDLAEKAGCDVSAMDGREYQAMWCDSYQLERFAASLIQAGAASRDAELSECRNKAIDDCARIAAQGEWKLTKTGKAICAALRSMKDEK